MSAAQQLVGQLVEPDDRCRRSAAARLSARSAWRLATKIVPAPWSASARAVSSLVSPAPRITTWRVLQAAEHAQREVDGDRGDAHAARADRRSPSARACRCVSAAANRRLVSGPVQPARIAASWARLTWPWISASPTIIDSRPAVTR